MGLAYRDGRLLCPCLCTKKEAEAGSQVRLTESPVFLVAVGDESKMESAPGQDRHLRFVGDGHCLAKPQRSVDYGASEQPWHSDK